MQLFRHQCRQLYADVAGNAGTGYSLAGSYGVGESFHLTGICDSVTLNSTAVSDLLAGVGCHMPMGDSADFTVDLNYRATSAGSSSWNGYTGNVGVRFKVADKAEVRASLGQTSVSGPTSKSGGVYVTGATYNI